VDGFNLIRYYDLEFLGHKENGVSSSCYLMSLGSITISWRAHKQLFPSYSTMEEEYVEIVEVKRRLCGSRKYLNICRRSR